MIIPPGTYKCENVSATEARMQQVSTAKWWGESLSLGASHKRMVKII